MATGSVKRFIDNLRELPSVAHIAQLELRDNAGRVFGVIENRPGSAGSVAVYHAVARSDGRLDRTAAECALHLYAEHVADARAQPGKHPNIDRLFQIIAADDCLQVHCINHPV